MTTRTILRRPTQGDGARAKALARLRGQRRIALASQMLHIAHERTRLEFELAIWRTKTAQAEANMRRLTAAADQTQADLLRLDSPPKPARRGRRGGRGATIIEY